MNGRRLLGQTLDVGYAVGEFAAAMSAVLQTMSWFTWLAAYRPAVVSPTWVDFAEFDLATDELFQRFQSELTSWAAE